MYSRLLASQQKTVVFVILWLRTVKVKNWSRGLYFLGGESEGIHFVSSSSLPLAPHGVCPLVLARQTAFIREAVEVSPKDCFRRLPVNVICCRPKWPDLRCWDSCVPYFSLPYTNITPAFVLVCLSMLPLMIPDTHVYHVLHNPCAWPFSSQYSGFGGYKNILAQEPGSFGINTCAYVYVYWLLEMVCSWRARKT